jgi:hypothetical protein
MSHAKKHFLFVLAASAALATGLVLASPAGATPPAHEDLGTIPYELAVDCTPFGFPFENHVLGAEVVSVDTFYDSHGVPTRVVVHDSFRETDTNSVSDRALRFGGNRVETFDLIAGTRTVVGRSFVMTDPGNGIVIHDTGRVVFDAPFHVSFSAGPHDVLYGDVDQLTCSALAAP